MDKRSIVLVLVFAALLVMSCSSQQAPHQEKPMPIKNIMPMNISNLPTVCVKSHCIDVELAITEKQQEEGLMNRTDLPKDSGMLFIFNEEDYHAFWMKNTLIPLDMVWIDAEGRVVYYYKDARPCPKNGTCPAIVPDRKAIYVLEADAGYIDSINLSIGDVMRIRIQ